MIIIEATVVKPDERGGLQKRRAHRKAFHDDDIEGVQSYIGNDWCFPYTEDECRVEFNYIKL